MIEKLEEEGGNGRWLIETIANANSKEAVSAGVYMLEGKREFA